MVRGLAPRRCGDFALRTGAIVGNSRCFKCNHIGIPILKYDVATREVSSIQLPHKDLYWMNSLLMATEDGKLGFVTVTESRLWLWSRVVASAGDAVWEQSRVIDLNVLIPADALSRQHLVASPADGIELVFVWTTAGVFSVDLKSSETKKVGVANGLTDFIPFTSFCTPELGVVTTDEGPGAVASSG
ncbi:hypothetical protein ACP4OV_012077 [Aristida adscensionis]